MFKEMVRKVRNEIRIYRNEKWTEKLKNINVQDSSLWKMTKVLKTQFETIPALKKDNKTALTDDEKVNMLATELEKIHNIDLFNNTAEQNNIIQCVEKFLKEPEDRIDEVNKTNTSPQEIRKTIKTVCARKAPGYDGIQNILLKNLSKKSIAQLTYIINAIFKYEYFPKYWKRANVIPIPKPGKDKKDPVNYRPISLLPTLSKITEKIILRKLKNYEEKHNLTIDIQFGFRKRHNTVQQVVRIVNDISIHFNKDKVTVLALLDIQKAFDKVWIDGLIYKMIMQKYPKNIIKLIHSYMVERNFKVVYNSACSGLKQIKAGVPQGSVLGPQLFKIYLNDIPEFDRTKLALFADDTAIYTHSFNAIVAAKQIQIHIYILEKYYDKWKININPDKTEIIVFSKKIKDSKILTPVTVYNKKIVPTNSVKYLGVHLDSRLTYRHHIKQALRKAYSVLKKIYSLMVKNSPVQTKNKRLIYTSILRPVVMYAAPVWCATAPTNIKSLQVFQNKCLRLAFNRDRYERISNLHNDAQLPLISEYIREISQAFYTNKIKNDNKILDNVVSIRHDDKPFRIKHRLPYQRLPIFYQSNT